MAKKPYTIRLDEEKVIKPLQDIADRENRTVTNLIETALIELVKKKLK
jgi:predicted transcriptional regulator